jgi:sodium-independent sulfate anion transporter 11
MVADIIKTVQASHGGQWDAITIAKALALTEGVILLCLGLLRLGWIIEFISEPAIGGFMTGAAITIATSQVPALFGVTGFE